MGSPEMMVDLHRSFAAPLSDETMFAWHRMLAGSPSTTLRILAAIVGIPSRCRLSRGRSMPEVHFEAPPSSEVPHEMSRFIDWFNRTAPDGPKPLPALTRAGIAHFYFVCIHPFEDGNGRIRRAIAEKALAQSVGRPTLTALAATILARRRAYYEALERSNTANELTDWLRWFAAVAIEQRRTMALVAFLIDKTRLLDRLKGSSTNGSRGR